MFARVQAEAMKKQAHQHYDKRIGRHSMIGVLLQFQKETLGGMHRA